MLKTILNRPVAVLTVFIVVVLVSIILSLGIPLDMYPDMDLPILAVTVTYPGAGPEEVEEEVVRVIEGELSGLEGMDSLESTSYENYGLILMYFDYGTDITESQAEVRSRLDRVSPSLPEEADDPVLQKFDPSSLPIMSLAVNGDRSERDLIRITEDEVVPELEAMSGVASVSLEGGRDSIVRVDVDQEALEAYGLSLTTVSGILAAQNLQLGAGSFAESDLDILIRTSGRFASLEEIERTVILTVPGAPGESGTPIALGDMAEVSWGYADADSLVRVNGERGLSLQIRKGSDANSVEVADAVKAELLKINRNLPDGVEISLLTDSTGQVRSNLGQVGSAAVLGIIFAVIVLMVFLRQLKSTIIAGLSIPIALVITIAGLAISGRTLNLVTLVGLSMGVGLIVDSSIVIIENIFRLRQKGAPMRVSAERGAGEMMSAIVASTLTTIAVFLPLVIYKNDLGFIGIFFGELAFVIILALVASLVVAAILVPVLSSRFLTIHTRQEKPIRNASLRRLDERMEKGLESLENAFARFLRRVIKRRSLVIGTAVVVLVGSLVLATNLDVSMMPETPESSINLTAEFPTGTAMGETERVMLEINELLAGQVPDADRMVVTAEKGRATMEITFVDGIEKDAEVTRVKDMLRGLFGDYPGVSFSFSADQNGAAFSSSGVDVSITGTDWDAVMTAADDIAALMSEVDGLEEVDNGAEKGLPQAEIIFDRQALYEQGLNAAAVASEVRALTAGTTSTTYIQDGETYDVVLRLEESDRSAVIDLERLFVTNAGGDRVSISQIAEVTRTGGPVTISREDQVRTIHVVGSLADGAAAQKVTDAARVLLESELGNYPGVEWSVGGEMDDFAETGTTMMYVLVLALLMVVAVMVAQFESFRDPMIIFMAMPMMLVGIIVVFLITGTTVSMVALMGVVMLLGIVVNNGIVLVDHARLMRRRGMGVVEAAVESGRSRLKPVLMTSLTTILAMTPMAFFPGEGGQMMQPMGIAVVGGLTTSMIGTLVMVPVFYTMVHRKERNDYTTRRDRRRMKRLEVAGTDTAGVAAGEAN